jgi:hypothetical protein
MEMPRLKFYIFLTQTEQDPSSIGAATGRLSILLDVTDKIAADDVNKETSIPYYLSNTLPL